MRGDSQQDGHTATDERSNRAQAEQLDFLNGIVLLLFGVGLFFAGAGVLLDIGADSSPDREGAAFNADQRLVGDLLVDDVGDSALDRACADAYFGRNETGVCIRAADLVDGSWSEQRWLRRSLGLESERGVNVTVVDNGSVVNSSGVSYALGPAPPSGAAVYESNRFVASGNAEYYTVLLRVW